MVRVKTVRRGRSPSAHQKTSEFGNYVRETRRRRPEIRDRYARHDGARLLSVKGE